MIRMRMEWKDLWHPDIDDPGDRPCHPLNLSNEPDPNSITFGNHTWARDGSGLCTRCAAFAVRKAESKSSQSERKDG